MMLNITIRGQELPLEIKREGDIWRCRLDGREFDVDVRQINDGTLSLLIGGRSFQARRNPELVEQVFIDGTRYDVDVQDPRSFRGNRRGRSREHHSQNIAASMPGKVVRLLAGEGEQIHAGQGIAIIEAMKMQNEIRSPREGTLLKLVAREGANVNAGEVLAIIE